MSKFSVKKPFTVLVMVVVMLILGIVSVTKMQLDLLPEMTLPYLLVITTYPGATPEQVERTISEPLEGSLGTINGVKNVYSNSYENYSMIQLEFEDDTDMDSVLVKVSTALDGVKSSFPETVGTPSIMELSMDMMATQYLAVSYEGMEMEELSRFVENNVVPQLERKDGVASVSSMGMIEQTLQVELNQAKVDVINGKILAKVQDAFEEAQEQLDDAKQALIDGQEKIDDGKKELANGQKELDNAKKELEDGKNKLSETEKETYAKLAEASYLLDQYNAYQSEISSINGLLATAQKALEEEKKKLPPKAEDEQSALKQMIADLRTMVDSIGEGQGDLTEEELQQIEEFRSTYKLIWDSIFSGEDATPLPEDSFWNLFNPDSDVTREEMTQRLQQNLDVAEAELDRIEGFIKLLFDRQTQVDLLTTQLTSLVTSLSDVEKQMSAIGTNYKELEEAKMQATVGFATAEVQISTGQAQLESAQAQIDSGKEGLKTAQEQIDSGWEQYNEGVEQFEEQKVKAEESANVDQLLTLSTLSALIYAQDFSMPAGYIDDADDNSWMLKIGDNYASIDELEDMVLVNIDGVGDVTLGSVADLTIIDNTGTTYTKLNSERAVILSIFKASTSGTNAVSKICKEAIEELEEKYDGLSILVMMDQGDYINIIVKSVVESMVLGAGLAILILAIFLKDFMPTIVVAISIPLSVLTALIAMYFSDISLNMMSLSGMALGIGMLVDNSIVVIENIYRLRGKNVPAPRAAVQGTKQVAGAIVASTLTTVCVFFPMIYTSGYVRQLLLPMSLTIIYCLMASLLIAMTVVPAAGSTLLRKTKPKEHKFFDKVQDIYGKTLYFCLKVKIVPLSVAIGLLALSIWLIIRMGIVMIPEMTSNQIQGNVSFEEESVREDVYAVMDELIYRMQDIPGIDSIGVMTGGSTALISVGGSNDSYTRYSLMVTTENEKIGAEEVNAITSQMEAIAADLGVDMTVSSGMGDMSSMLGSGLSIPIYGSDLDTLLAISDDIMEIIESVEGYTEISNGQEDADTTLHIYIDKNESMRLGLTVAQIYQEMATSMTTTATPLKVTLDGIEMDLKVVNELSPVTVENIMDHSFTVTKTDDKGKTTTEKHALSEFATLVEEPGFSGIRRQNQSRFITVSASVAEGYNTTLLTRELEPLLEAYDLPEGYSISLGGEYETVNKMVEQMSLVLLLGLAFIYLVMVAQFQSLLSPFIVLFTIPLAFTGGLLALWAVGENLSIISLMGFLVLMGTVVNNGIVFVDYSNQLRIGGMERHDALVATGKTRMRPILMTAMTTILAEFSLILGDDMGSQMGKGMALVIVGGLAYATLMTLYIIPVMYDILFKKKPLSIDVGDDNLDDVPDDAADFMASMLKEREGEAAEALEAFEPIDAAEEEVFAEVSEAEAPEAEPDIAAVPSEDSAKENSAPKNHAPEIGSYEPEPAEAASENNAAENGSDTKS